MCTTYDVEYNIQSTIYIYIYIDIYMLYSLHKFYKMLKKMYLNRRPHQSGGPLASDCSLQSLTSLTHSCFLSACGRGSGVWVATSQGLCDFHAGSPCRTESALPILGGTLYSPGSIKPTHSTRCLVGPAARRIHPQPSRLGPGALAVLGSVAYLPRTPPPPRPQGHHPLLTINHRGARRGTGGEGGGNPKLKTENPR